MQAPNPLPAAAQDVLKKLQSLCPMRLEHYEWGDQKLGIWTACDIDPLLNSLMEKEEGHPDVLDERMPYWAELWPSSFLIAETILERKDRLPEGQWLELGCGPGLAGIMAAKNGRRGICSDYMEEALWLASLNSYQNRCEDKIHFEHLDWRSPPRGLKTSWVLAADVTYEERNFDPLYSAFETLLLPEGEIWLAEPGRSVAKSFFKGMESHGWNHEVLKERDEVKLHRFHCGIIDTR